MWYLRAALAAHMVKNLPAMQETWVRSLEQEDPLEKGMANHSSILAWSIPWTEEPGRLYIPWGHKESDTSKWLALSLFPLHFKCNYFLKGEYINTYNFELCLTEVCWIWKSPMIFQDTVTPSICLFKFLGNSTYCFHILTTLCWWRSEIIKLNSLFVHSTFATKEVIQDVYHSYWIEMNWHEIWSEEQEEFTYNFGLLQFHREAFVSSWRLRAGGRRNHSCMVIDTINPLFLWMSVVSLATHFSLAFGNCYWVETMWIAIAMRSLKPRPKDNCFSPK